MMRSFIFEKILYSIAWMGDSVIRYISLFSGIEAASCAWKPLGCKPIAFSEIEPFPRAVLAHHYPDVPDLGDITKIDWSPYVGSADIVVGGSPCQSFSVAGSRTGLAGASGLMWEYVRAVRELRPQWFVWENVPGALSSSHGEDFRCLLGSMDELGYGLAWRVLDAQFFGVAQRRRRVFLVGHLGDRRAAEVLFEPESLRWDSPSSREKRQAIAQGTQGRARASGRSIDWNRTEGRCRWPADPTLVQTLSAHMGTVGDNVPPVYQIAGNIIGREPENGGHQLGITDPDENGTYTLTATDRHGVYCASDSGTNSSVNLDIDPTLTVHESKSASYVSTGNGSVRRLTPVECERLQGFPDDWTDIPYRGKPHAPDSARYKALGNSMAVPVMQWIGKRIKEASA